MRKKLLHSYKININNDEYLCFIKVYENMKSLKIKVTNDLEIHVHVPPKISIDLVKGFVNNNLLEIKKIIDKKSASKFYNPNNNLISLFGKEHNLITKNHSGNEKYVIGYKTVTLYLKNESNKVKLIKKLFKNESQKYTTNRAFELAKIYGFNVEKINIKWMVGCWGNCRKSLKLINFSSRLITFPKEIIDYVIIHELCHLIEANHSERFWSLVSKIYPNYKQARQYLKNF